MRDRWTLGLGAFALAFALIALFLWIPNDVATGVIEQARRRTVIGDAFAPTMIAIGIALVSIALIAGALWRRLPEHTPPPGRLSQEDAAWLLASVVILAVGLTLMVQTGPLAVALAHALGAQIGSYRELIDTPPWKYLGYLAGGVVLVGGYIGLIEHRLSWRTVAIALIAVVAMAALYDLPFEDLLLPPNGDQ